MPHAFEDGELVRYAKLLQTKALARAEETRALWFYSLVLEMVSKWTSIEICSRRNLCVEKHFAFLLRGAPNFVSQNRAQTRLVLDKFKTFVFLKNPLTSALSAAIQNHQRGKHRQYKQYE